MSRKTRKLIWSAPLLAVLAVAGALAIFAAQMPNVAFAAKPSAPTSLSATATSATQINLSWTAATVGGDDPAVSGYKIEVSTTGATSWSRLVENTRDTGTTYQDMGLEAGQRRHYRVSAINMDGTSTPSNIDNATTWSKPAAPTELAATADSSSGDTAINLTWVDVPTPTDGSTISAYQVEASRSSSGPWTVLDDDVSGGTQSYDHAGLMAGQTWHYQVSATRQSPPTRSKRHAAPPGLGLC
jgi:titin